MSRGKASLKDLSMVTRRLPLCLEELPAEKQNVTYCVGVPEGILLTRG